ncbi:MAG: response regulator [Bacteroidia bacterium]|nr:response regulator [Bacteroidia bacterium]
MIFLIDDDDIQNLINTKVISLVSDQHPVKAFTSAEMALETLSAGEQPKLIFLDINMPKMNGWDFLDVYHERNLPIDVYMLSSSINNKDIEKSKTYESVKGFICKPLVVEKLTEILKEENLI